MGFLVKVSRMRLSAHVIRYGHTFAAHRHPAKLHPARRSLATPWEGIVSRVRGVLSVGSFLGLFSAWQNCVLPS